MCWRGAVVFDRPFTLHFKHTLCAEAGAVVLEGSFTLYFKHASCAEAGAVVLGVCCKVILYQLKIHCTAGAKAGAVMGFSPPYADRPVCTLHCPGCVRWGRKSGYRSCEYGDRWGGWENHCPTHRWPSTSAYNWWAVWWTKLCVLKHYNAILIHLLWSMAGRRRFC